MNVFKMREKRTLTGFGRLLFAGLLIALLLLAANVLYPFLAQHRPLTDARLAIIEGWIPDAELRTALQELPPDTIVVATGGPIRFGADFFEQKTYAGLTADRLRAFGIAPERILAAPAPDMPANRTYAAARAARRALEEHGVAGEPANIYTVGPHSRRSFLLYRFAFGPEAPLGVVSLESRDLDLRRWWRSSHAFKAMLTELTSWFYTQCTRWKY